MFIELVDALRCPNQHEESWLIAAADRMEHRHIVHGALGCPVCHAEYPIRDGVVDFRTRVRDESIVALSPPAEGPAFHEVSAIKLAALLNLTDAQGFAVLLGEWCRIAHALREIVETPLILVDPPTDMTGQPGISVLRSQAGIPLANGATRAIAIDEESRLLAALRVVKAGGRIVAPVAITPPDDVNELARDESVWVGERKAPASPLISLHVRRA
jgi:uncharacterized protein YbaR (Trm112 family)